MKHLSLIIAILLLFGCRAAKYAPPQTNVSKDQEFVYRDRVRVDTVKEIDRTYIKVGGDTVYVYKYQDRIKIKYETKNDTMYINRTDSIMVPYAVPAKLNKWQRLKVDWGGWALLAIVLGMSGVLFKMKGFRLISWIFRR